MQLSVESEHAKQTKWRLKEGLDYIWKGTLQSVAATNVLSAIHLVVFSHTVKQVGSQSAEWGPTPDSQEEMLWGVVGFY